MRDTLVSLEKLVKLGDSNDRLAVQRIRRLFQLARDTIHENEELAQRYVAVARRVAMASRVRIPRECRRQMCRSCKKLILPGVNCRVRIQQLREPHLVMTCGYCGVQMRIPTKLGKKGRGC